MLPFSWVLTEVRAVLGKRRRLWESTGWRHQFSREPAAMNLRRESLVVALLPFLASPFR